MLHGERAPRSFAAQQLKPESMVNNALTTWPIICRCSNDSFLKSWAMNFSDLQQQDPDVLMDSPGDDEAMLPRLLSTIADLFASQLHHSPDEIQQFEAAVEGLLPHTSEDMRIKAAERLADYPYLSPRVLEAFLGLGGRVAAPFLARSVCLTRAQIAEIAREGEPDAACQIAKRIDLDATLVGLLCTRMEIEVLRLLAHNLMAPIEKSDFEGLARQARFDQPLAKSLCRRARDPQWVTPLFLSASSLQRDAIILAARRASLGEPMPAPLTDDELALAHELLKAASDRNLDEASWLVAKVAGCTTTLARDIIADAGGEPLALVLAILRVDPLSAGQILTKLDAPPLRSPDRLQKLVDLVCDTPRSSAERILKEIVGLAAPRHRGLHLPVNDPTAAQTPSRPVQMGVQTETPESDAEEPKRLFVRH